MPLVLSGGARFAGGIRGSAPAAVVAPPATDSYFMYNSLLLQGNGTNNSQNNTFLDGSTNNFTVTRNGNTTQGTFSPYGANWSNYFDGTGDYLSAGSNSAFAVGTGDFTFQVWVYPTAYTSPVGAIFDTGSGVASGRFSVVLYANGILRVDNNTNLLSSNSALPLNQWTFISIIRSSGTMTMYFNGTSVASGSITNNFTETQGIIGKTVDNYYFQGYISNFSLVKGTALANTVPTTPLTVVSGTSLLTCADNRFIDDSTNAFAITVNGNTSVQRFSPFSPTAAYSAGTIGGSAYFDGNSDYLNVPDNDSWALGNNFTIECWVYFTTTSGIQQFINQRSSSSDAWQFLYNYPNSGDLTFKFADGNVAINRTWSPTVGQWYHIAVTRSSSTWYLFANGVQLGATATNSTTFPNIAASVWVGTLQNPTAESFVGYMCDMRVVKSSVYTSAFTPPTAPVTAVANTQLLLNYTNAGIIDNTMINNLETVGNAQISTAQSKFGGSSMYFDGTGDYLTTPFSPLTQFGTGDFTIEFWLYRTGGSVYQTILDTRSSGTASPWAVLLNSSNQPYILIASDITSSIAVASATWTHIAICRASGTLRIFNDGVVGYSGANSTSMMPTGPLRIGKTIDNVYDLNGYIDDLRVTKGYARYTTTFTPPTAELPNQ